MSGWCVVCGCAQDGPPYVEVDKGPVCDPICLDAYMADVCGHCGEIDGHEEDCPAMGGSPGSGGTQGEG